MSVQRLQTDVQQARVVLENAKRRLDEALQALWDYQDRCEHDGVAIGGICANCLKATGVFDD